MNRAGLFPPDIGARANHASGAPRDEVLLQKVAEPERRAPAGKKAVSPPDNFASRFRHQDYTPTLRRGKKSASRAVKNGAAPAEPNGSPSRTERKRGPRTRRNCASDAPGRPTHHAAAVRPRARDAGLRRRRRRTRHKVPGRAVVPPARPRATCITSSASTHGTAPTGPSATGTKDERIMANTNAEAAAESHQEETI